MTGKLWNYKGLVVAYHEKSQIQSEGKRETTIPKISILGIVVCFSYWFLPFYISGYISGFHPGIRITIPITNMVSLRNPDFAWSGFYPYELSSWTITNPCVHSFRSYGSLIRSGLNIYRFRIINDHTYSSFFAKNLKKWPSEIDFKGCFIPFRNILLISNAVSLYSLSGPDTGSIYFIDLFFMKKDHLLPRLIHDFSDSCHLIIDENGNLKNAMQSVSGIWWSLFI